MRWKGFIPFLLITAIIFVTGIFFLDTIIHRTVERAGSAVWGAKVEIEDLSISWSPPGVVVEGFTVASRSREYENLMEIGRMRFAVLGGPLFERKLVIEEISGTGLAFGTPRESSGFLPRKEKPDPEDREEESRWKEMISSWLEDIRERASERIDVRGYFSVEDLKSVRELRRARAESETFRDEFEELDPEEASERVEELKGIREEVLRIRVTGPEDIGPAREKLRRAEESVSSAGEYAAQVRGQLEELRSSAGEIRESIHSAADARRDDYRALMDKMRLPSIETEDIAETVFGPLITRRVTGLVSAVETVRRYIPPKKDKPERVVRTRHGGTVIHFDRRESYPAFLLKEALISGTDGEKLQVRDLTGDPMGYGRPGRVKVSYDRFDGEAVFDRTREEPVDTLTASYENFRIADGRGDLELSAVFTAGEIDSDISWSGRGLLPENWVDFLRLDDPPVEVKVRVRGSLSSPRLSISSSLDTLISEHLRRELEREIARAREEARELVDSEVLRRRDEILSDTEAFRREQEERLLSALRSVEEERDALKARVEEKRAEIEERVSAAEAAARKAAEEARREAEKKAGEAAEELREETEERIRGLFR